MKLLLTDSGITNTSIQNALVDLLGKPIAESSALCIPTAAYGNPGAGPGAAWRFISGRQPVAPMCGLGWKSLGVLELTALPSSKSSPRGTGSCLPADIGMLLVSGTPRGHLCPRGEPLPARQGLGCKD
jgi:dipeptidase E